MEQLTKEQLLQLCRYVNNLHHEYGFKKETLEDLGNGINWASAQL